MKVFVIDNTICVEKDKWCGESSCRVEDLFLVWFFIDFIMVLLMETIGSVIWCNSVLGASILGTIFHRFYGFDCGISDGVTNESKLMKLLISSLFIFFSLSITKYKF